MTKSDEDPKTDEEPSFQKDAKHKIIDSSVLAEDSLEKCQACGNHPCVVQEVEDMLTPTLQSPSNK